MDAYSLVTAKEPQSEKTPRWLQGRGTAFRLFHLIGKPLSGSTYGTVITLTTVPLFHR